MSNIIALRGVHIFFPEAEDPTLHAFGLVETIEKVVQELQEALYWMVVYCNAV
jgi:hypothetical protein